MLALYDLSAPAKLNLFLHVVGKRADGYHLLQSIFTLIDWADTLHFERRGDGRLARHDLGEALPADDLCLRAARLLQQESGCGFGADIHIDKQLPAGAGMGGGSSDAATTLLALNRLWGLDWPRRRLLELGLRLGADVPFFIGGSPAFVEGIGELLHPIDLPELAFAVLKPPQGISTQQIFSSPLLARSKSVAIVAGFPAHDGSDDKGQVPESDARPETAVRLDAEGIASLLGDQGGEWGRNDLQPPAEASCPEVVQALQLLRARFGNSRMTGSGSAVFARVQADVKGKNGMSSQSMATILEGLPEGWIGKMCRSLARHPLQAWARD